MARILHRKLLGLTLHHGSDTRGKFTGFGFFGAGDGRAHLQIVAALVSVVRCRWVGRGEVAPRLVDGKDNPGFVQHTQMR